MSSPSSLSPAAQSIVMLDLEGVLVPEIWIAVAQATGIEELKRTTRDEPDYNLLMKGRLQTCDQAGLELADIVEVIATLRPLAGAREFLDELRAHTQVVILSDTFEEFGKPLMAHLGWPTLLCHRLVVEAGRITDYQLRMPDQKASAVKGFRQLNYRVVAAGDSYNDTTMLAEAHEGFLFRSPDNVKAEFPHYDHTDSYDELFAYICAALTG